MSRFGKLLAAVGATMCCSGVLHATGYFGPDLYLDNGGQNVAGSPEFYWDLELKRLASDFHPTEKLVESEKPEPNYEDGQQDTRGSDDSNDADLKDFDTALKEGRIKPPDAAKAKQAHADARAMLHSMAAAATPLPSASSTESASPTVAPSQSAPQHLPAEFDSEFADYHRGAFAYAKKRWDEAQPEWEKLLKRPEQDRHYRTTWAAFMLGKVALKNGDFPAAVQWFERTRELAKNGFADSLGLAADSYGWEGRAEWKQDHPEKAAQLFLTQLALGDESAVVSLKALIPDRDPVEGMLNYGPRTEESAQNWTDQQKHDEDQKEAAKLKAAVKDPLLRRLVTVHILATAVAPEALDTEGQKSQAVNRCARWLTIIKQANLGRLEDAEYLGWVAYNNGDYKDAAHWLELSKPDSAAALWLKAKLQRRAGKWPEATNTMAQAVEQLEASPYYYTEDDTSGDGHWGFCASANGDLGALRLSRGDFVQAFDALFQGELWEDAAFVAERVLTTNELKEYVDSLKPEEKKEETKQPQQTEQAEQTGDDKNYNGKLQYLLGRRLVREDRYDEAKKYLPADYVKMLEKYVKALQDGANDKLSKTERAHAWFTAAWIARHDGMELMGTEGAPDGFAEYGDAEMPDLGKQRQTGFYQTIAYDKDGGTLVDKDGNEKKKSVPVTIKATPKEIQRLNANKVQPDIRFHYRIIAGALAMKAAALLPDNSEELADVVNQAGLWVKDRDEKTGDRYYQVIDHRCAKTKIGQTDRRKHWFVDQEGPWSVAEQKAFEALHKEAGLPASPDAEPESSASESAPESSPSPEPSSSPE